MSKEYDEWAFTQCVINGNTIEGIKNKDGVNVKFINTTTKEEFVLSDDINKEDSRIKENK